MEQILELSIYSMSIKLFEKKIHISLNKNGNHPRTIWIVDLSVGGEGILFEFHSRFLSFFLVNARGIQLKFLDMPQ